MKTSEHTIDCTGDVVSGDEVSFERAVFSGSYPKAKFSHLEHLTGKVIADSYGSAKQQHTFTIILEDGDKIRIKGRNLYRNDTHRKPWADESLRNKVADEKHARGTIARQEASERKSRKYSSQYQDNGGDDYGDERDF